MKRASAEVFVKLSSRIVALVFALFAGACDAQAPAASIGLGTHAFGERCARTEDCSSGLCLRVDVSAGVCTHGCAAAKDCPHGDNWACLAPDGFGERVCACRKTSSEEICGNGLDDDCNGLVDDCLTCGGSQVSRDDHENCGACGRACRADQACSLGKCSCASVGEQECGGRCVDVRTDEASCGACGKACPTAQTCSAGSCGCPSLSYPDYCAGSGCIDRTSDAANCGTCGNACGVGQVCKGGSCTCPASAGGDFCAGVGCVDRQTDAANCGACGNACGAGHVCTGGVCGCPASASTDCSGQCVNTATSSTSCGACGNACGAGQYCKSGACACSSSGLSVCGATCADLRFDAKNCGACGTTCAPGEICSSGACTCTSGLHCGGACMAASDVSNCGACGMACGAGQYCSAGRCACSTYGLTACGAACVNAQTDTANCGACGVACRSGETCTAGKCACPSGQTWCDSAGKCVSMQSDTANCGACGKACRATESCNYGTCGCPSYSQLWCAADGVCVDSYSSATNCGACGKTCRASEVCAGAACRCPSYGQQWCATAAACVDTLANGANCGACDVACPAGTSCTSSKCTCPTAGLTLCASSCVDLKVDTKNCGACGKVCDGTTVCTGSTCLCPAPVVGSPTRLTNAFGPSVSQHLAWNGTYVGVVWSEQSQTTDAAVHFALLWPDGTRAPGADVVVGQGPALFSEGWSSHGPWITWTGTQWVVLWTAKQGVLEVRGFDSTGTPNSTTASIKPLGAEPFSGDVAFSPSQGFGFLYEESYGASFRRLGPNATTPEAPVSVRSLPASYWRRPMHLGVSPTGQWGFVLPDAAGASVFVRLNPDGSHTIPDVPLPINAQYGVPAIAHDGATWLAAYVDAPGATSTLMLARGDTLSSTFKLFTEANATSGVAVFRPSALLLGGGNLDLFVDSMDWTSDGNGIVRLFRYRLPGGPTSAPTPLLSGPATILGTPNATSRLTLSDAVHLGPSRVFSAWTDNRWGSSNYEVYGAAVDFLGCP